MRRMLLIITVLLALVATGACSKKKTASAPKVNAIDVGLQEYGFAVSGQAKAGPLTLNFTNTGKEMHMAIVGRLDPGKTIEDVRAEVAKGEEGPPPPWFHDDPADLSILSPGESAGLTIDAGTAGTYALLCFIPSPDGKPHVALGMTQSFEVSGTSDASAPTGSSSFTITGDSVNAPPLTAGRVTVEVKNTGSAPADFNILRLAEGKKLDEIDAWFEKPEGPPPATFFGGTHGIEPGKSIVMSFDLDPGTYTAAASIEVEGQEKQKEITTTFTVS